MPAPGDAVFYGTRPSESLHVGIVARVLTDGEIETIEGNYAGHVTRVGPFEPPSHPVGERAPIYGYAQPPTPRTGQQLVSAAHRLKAGPQGSLAGTFAGFVSRLPGRPYRIVDVRRVSPITVRFSGAPGFATILSPGAATCEP